MLWMCNINYNCILVYNVYNQSKHEEKKKTIRSQNKDHRKSVIFKKKKKKKKKIALAYVLMQVGLEKHPKKLKNLL